MTAADASGPILTFAAVGAVSFCEGWNQRTASKILILVELWIWPSADVERQIPVTSRAGCGFSGRVVRWSRGGKVLTSCGTPGRRKPLAHSKPAQRPDRADQMQARRTQRLHGQKIAEQRAISDVDREGTAQHVRAPRPIVASKYLRAARIFAGRERIPHNIRDIAR